MAKRLADPDIIAPDNQTAAQKRRGINAAYWQQEVDAGRAVPEAAEAAQILNKNDGSWLGSFWDALHSRAEVLIAAIAGTAGSGTGTGPLSEQSIETIDGPWRNPVWNRVPVERGELIEQEWGHNLPKNFVTLQPHAGHRTGEYRNKACHQ